MLILRARGTLQASVPRAERDRGESNHTRSVAFLIAFLLFITAHARAGQNSPATKFRLRTIDVSGLQRASRELAITASGLTIGQQVDVSGLNAAADRMVASGFFTNVRYQYRTQSGEGDVIFTVEEAQWNGRIVFDNFVWFRDEELVAAIRQSIPQFNGTLPDGDAVATLVIGALQRLLEDRKLPGKVEHTSSPGSSTSGESHTFEITGVEIPVCAAMFPGNTAVPESELLSLFKPVLIQNYSRSYTASTVRANLSKPFLQRGYLKVRFLPAQAEIFSGANCTGGVRVAVPVAQGLEYLWEKPHWNGITLFNANDLDLAIGLKAGDVADGIKIQKGLEAVQYLYRTRGMLELELKASPRFDDTNRRVEYDMSITEGRVYRMGSVTFVGLQAAEADRAKAKWRLQPGSVYDASAIGQFVKALMSDRSWTARKFQSIAPRVIPHPEKLTADVEIEFK